MVKSFTDLCLQAEDKVDKVALVIDARSREIFGDIFEGIEEFLEASSGFQTLFLDDKNQAMLVNCMSFGFKYGLPQEADLVFDVRCLPNPFYVPELKSLTGLDAPVREYVLKWEQAQKLIPKLFDLVDYLLPLYRDEGKTQLTIAVGCTGGKHRSVVFAQLLEEHMQEQKVRSTVTHRDIAKRKE